MGKVHFIWAILLFCLIVSTIEENTGSGRTPMQEQQNESPEEDAAIQKLSQFFIELINQYDKSGSGIIKREIYPLFLKDVFLKGSFGDDDDKYEHKQLLLQATTEFTESKDKEIESISIQQFYEDIINKFTLFVIENEKYQKILETLFEDLKPKDVKQKKLNEKQTIKNVVENEL